MRRLATLAGLIFLVALPAWAPLFWINVGSQMLIFAIFALSIDLVLGYGGMPSLGHAAFYGAGAYAAALVALHLPPSLPLMLAVGVLAGAIVAAVIGGLALRAQGIYFLMLTLAFGQMLWALALRWTSVTGGSDGLFGIPRPPLQLGQIAAVSIATPRSFFLLVLVCAAAIVAVLFALIRSPFGKSLVAIRENDRRARAAGYAPFAFRWAALVMSGAVAGLAGVLAALFNGYANPGQLHWTTSGLGLVAVILGGSRSLLGPILGASVIILTQTALSSLSDHWELLLGSMFVLVVLYLPGGVVRLPQALRQLVPFAGALRRES
jgi:branched-chain amino acid transport system permease protein